MNNPVNADGTITRDDAPWRAFVQRVGQTPKAGFVYLQVTETDGVLSAVDGPFFGSSVPANFGSTYYVALAQSDGAGGVEPIHTDTIQWP